MLTRCQSTLQTIIQGVAIFMLTRFIVNQIFGDKSGQQNQQGPPVKGQIGRFEERPDMSTVANYSTIPQMLVPIWQPDTALDISVYVSSSFLQPPLDSLPLETKVVDEKNFHVGDYQDTRDIHTSVKLPRQVQENGTLWAHFYVAISGSELDPMAKDYDSSKAFRFSRPLTQYLAKKRVHKLKNLLNKTVEPEEEDEEEPHGVQIASFDHPNFTLSVIPDSGVQNWQAMHPALRKHVVMEATGARDATGQNGWYYPIVFLNTFWQLRSHMTEINATVKEVPLNIHLNNIANWKYTLLASMDEGVKQNQAQAAAGKPLAGGGDGTEFEKVKEILLDTNPYLLATTFTVSILHMIFEGLAFKNDISHWRKKKDVVGTSVRTILANVFMQTVIFLYLVDNSENTSWMILASQGFGILLEAWKITKTVNVRLREPGPDSRFKFLPYVVVFEDKHQLSETEQKTKEYDEIAFRYLYMVAVPLLAAYAAYSLVYETHKSWYSFVIETLVGSVYAYGFLMMVPSLYINYRLKSVAHMPSKAMTYKFLNTFIDDLFAFTIRMPTLHRLATLRDDVIFFIWLWQKWKYKVDYSRVNEFGQGGESEDEAAEPGSGDAKNKNPLADQDTKQLHPTAPVSPARATGSEVKGSAKKRKA